MSAIGLQSKGAIASTKVEASQRWLWIGGWGLSSTYTETIARRHFPNIEHCCLAPTRNWSKALGEGPFSHLIGYSLGAFLVLLQKEMHRIEGGPSIMLFAPFIDFKREAEVGGRIAAARLNILHRQLTRRPLETLNNFYAAAGLGLPSPKKLPYPLEDLLWGIEVLLQKTVAPETMGPALSFIGDRDPLLDATVMSDAIPNLNVLSRVDHRLERLISRCLLEGLFQL